MNALYRAIGISKQSFHQSMERQMLHLEEEQQLLPLIREIRQDHPSMSSREMYRLLKPEHMGRDKFEAFCFANGFKIEIKRSFIRTTNSLGITRFENLMSGWELTGINQVWVSDITYYRIGDQFYYITFILDLSSRYIVGYAVSESLMTENTTIPALKKATLLRKPQPGLIFHSDGGGQYYCKEFLALTRQHHIRNSMCESVYENAHAERVNGTIKNDYLIHYGPHDFKRLKEQVRRAVDMYNFYRPHKALSGLSPMAFEKLLTEKPLINKRKKEAKKEKITSSLTLQ
jgi:putative transposase